MSSTVKCPRILRIVIAATAFMVWLSANAQQPPTKPSSKADATPVHSIVLPQYTPAIADGPNKATYQKNCLTCHTARYVSMQPHFSKTVWQNEVKKMVDAYGAPIPEADQALIVEYLVAVKGVEASTAPAVPTK